MKKPFPFFLLALALGVHPPMVRGETPTNSSATNTVPFEEIEKLIRQHLAETSDEELNDAAVKGLIEQLKPHVVLGHAPVAGDSTNSLVAKVERFRHDFGYLRVSTVRDGLPEALREAIDKLLADSPLRGLVIDLRFTGGTDYAAAAHAAGMFTESDGVLLRAGEVTYEGSPKDGAILIPLMVLINGSTSGAGEAFAAVLRSVKAGMLIGGKTAGEAMLFEEFPLSNGQVISIASQAVQIGDGKTIPRTGLTADIAVSTTEEEDRHYLADPYWEANPATIAQFSVPHRRITEADLVRQRREGIPLQQIISNSVDTASNIPNQVHDAALGRALDMLKALSVVQTWKQQE